jgi:hypothetical protein
MAFLIEATQIVFETLDTNIFTHRNFHIMNIECQDVFLEMHVQYHGDYFISIYKIIIIIYILLFPPGPYKKKKKDLKKIVPPNIVFSKIRIKTLELAFETLGICHICIFKNTLRLFFHLIFSKNKLK